MAFYCIPVGNYIQVYFNKHEILFGFKCFQYLIDNNKHH